MTRDRFTRVMLVLIFAALVANLVGPWLAQAPAWAAGDEIFGEDVRVGSSSRRVSGLATGDVNNDGLLDVLVIDDGRIFVKLGLREPVGI